MKVRTYFSVLLLCICLAANGKVVSAQEMTEQGVLSRFTAENQTLQALEAQVRVVRAEARRTGLAPNPAATYTREDAGNSLDNFLLIQQSVPLNGRLGLMRRAGAASSEAAESASAYALWSLRCDVRIAFTSLLLAQEREASWGRGVVEVQEVTRILRERESAGEGSTFDRLRVERELAEAQAQHATAAAQRAQAQGRLASFFANGTSISTMRVIGELAWGETLAPVDELIRRALERRGDHMAEVKQADRYEYERRAAQREKIPDPVVSAGLKRSRLQGSTDNGYAVSVSVALPLFNRGQADAARAQASADQSLAISRALEQQIRAEVEGAYAALEIRMRMAREYGRELGTAGDELSRISQAAYQDGEQNILELLDSYRVALTSRARVLELQAEARFAAIELERALGDEVTP